MGSDKPAAQDSKVGLEEKVKRICDAIMKEESPKFKSDEKSRPKGPNIFLAIELWKKEGTDRFEFLCLEREFKENFIVSLISCPPIRRLKVWEVNEDNEKKILQYFAEILKYVKGEK
jgi:hypothetical protein